MGRSEVLLTCVVKLYSSTRYLGNIQDDKKTNDPCGANGGTLAQVGLLRCMLGLLQGYPYGLVSPSAATCPFYGDS